VPVRDTQTNSAGNNGPSGLQSGQKSQTVLKIETEPYLRAVKTEIRRRNGQLASAVDKGIDLGVVA